MLYLIQATITRMTKGEICTHQVPTFLLSSHQLGIVDNEHAAEIAYSMIEGINPDCGICLTARDEQANVVVKHAGNRKKGDAK